jgi:hypothetical protein
MKNSSKPLPQPEFNRAEAQDLRGKIQQLAADLRLTTAETRKTIRESEQLLEQLRRSGGE